MAVQPNPKKPPALYAVKEAWQETHDIRVLRLAPQAGEPVWPFESGMFVVLVLVNPDRSLTDYHAAYTIASSPQARDYYEIAYKVKGPFTQALARLKPGDLIGVTPPEGKGHMHEGGAGMALIGGGIGIAPCISVLRDATERRSQTPVTFIYSVHAGADLAYHNELQRLQSLNPSLKVVYTLTRCPADQSLGLCESGRVNEQMLRKHVPDSAQRRWFLCGSFEMTRSMLVLLKQLGVPLTQVRFESWG